MLFAYLDVLFVAFPILIFAFTCCGWCVCGYCCWSRFCYCGFRRRKVGGRKTALVTGGSGGIGYSLAKLLVEDEYNVILVARNQEKLENAKGLLEEIIAEGYEDINISIRTFSCDFSNPQNVRDLVDTLEQENIHVDVLINNAGFGNCCEFRSHDERNMMNMINCNVTSLTLLTRLLLPKFVENGQEGKILNVASVGGFLPVPRFSVYGATKSYVRSFSQALNFELKSFPNISCTCLSPGATSTEFDKVSLGEGKKTKFTESSKYQSADDCAFEGYRSMMLGEYEVISGFQNWVTMKLLAPLLDIRAYMAIANDGFQTAN